MTEPEASPPRVYVTVPGVEDLTTVIELLRGAGAELTTASRQFVVEGPLTPEQASAVWQLAHHVDSGTEENRMGVQVVPPGDLAAALDVMCPGGWQADSFVLQYGDWGDADRWWRDEQQRRPRRLGAPPPTVPAPPAAVAPEAGQDMCCGEGGVWAPAGKPRVVGCQLCPNSPTYWRRQSRQPSGL